MFQNLGAGNGAVLVDMTHHKYGNPLLLGKLHQSHGAVLHLRNAAGRGFILLIVKGLNGIRDQNVRGCFFHGFQNIGQPCLRQNQQLRRLHAQALCPQLQLTLAFLAGDIQHTTLGAEPAADLQQQCGFSDSRSAAHKDEGACHGAAAQDTIQFSHSGIKADFIAAVNL